MEIEDLTYRTSKVPTKVRLNAASTRTMSLITAHLLNLRDAPPPEPELDDNELRLIRQFMKTGQLELYDAV